MPLGQAAEVGKVGPGREPIAPVRPLRGRSRRHWEVGRPLDQPVEDALVSCGDLEPSLVPGPLRDQRLVRDLGGLPGLASANQHQALALRAGELLDQAPPGVVELGPGGQAPRGTAGVAEPD
jgi:hypothetical protein